MIEEEQVREKMDMKPIVHYVLGQYMVPIDLLEDIMQRLYLKSHEYLNGETKKPIGYLAQSLRNEILKTLNEEKKQIELLKRCRESLQEKEVETPYDTYIKKELEHNLVKAVFSLSSFETTLILKRFGLGYYEPHTLQKLADEWKRTPAGIKWIIENAFEKIKKTHGNILKEYL